jgi:hypothetical protein
VEALLAIVALAALAFAYLDRRTTEKARSVERDRWELERQVLLNRIQHPEIMPRFDTEEPMPDAEYLTAETDPEYENVGKVFPMNGEEPDGG